MKSNEKKKLTRDFFNKVAGEWIHRTYDPDSTYDKFPSNRARMEVALKEIDRLKLTGRMLDIGCGAGQTVIELLKKHNDAYGIDASEGMIAIARENLMKSDSKKISQDIFRVADIGELAPGCTRYRVVTALGFLEYLNNDGELFSVLERIILRGGYAIVGSRNKLFNLFSVNEHTNAQKRNLTRLLKDFAESEQYSPTSTRQIPEVYARVYADINAFLQKSGKDKRMRSKDVRTFSSFPRKLALRSHTPRELAYSAKKYNFRLERIVYYHAHPCPPAYGREFPRFYNKLSLLMAPLGYTPLGAWMCSGLVAVLRKK